MTMLPALEVNNLGKLYKVDHQKERGVRAFLDSLLKAKWLSSEAAELYWSLRGVTFSIAQGEIVGLVGGNGAGKSTLLKLLTRVTFPTEGEGFVRGRVGCLLEADAGFHPELTGRENIFLSGILLGMSHSQVKKNFDAIVDFSGVSRFLDTPVKHYSSGMNVRLGFAIASFLQADVLIVDEVLAVGDAAFEQQCLARIREISQSGTTVLIVSHDMAIIESLCPRVLVLENGRLVFDGAAGKAIMRYYDHRQAKQG